MKERMFISVNFFNMIDVESVQKLLKKTGIKMTLVEPNKLHITLKFLGDTEVSLIDEIMRIIGDCTMKTEPFEVKFKGVGFFPHERKIRVVWIGVDDDGKLKQIADCIEKKLQPFGFRYDGKFEPHLTICRVKGGPSKKIINAVEDFRKTEFGNAIVSEIYLMKSNLTPRGPIYEVIKSVKL